MSLTKKCSVLSVNVSACHVVNLLRKVVLGVFAFLPFLRIINTHPKLLRACVHAAANHQAVTWFEDMQGARHGGVSHGTHKDRHVLSQAAQERRKADTFESGHGNI